MIFYLFIITFIIALIGYKISPKHFLSLTFISSIMFSMFSFLYILFFSYIGYDISLKTLLVISLSEVFILLGELSGEIKFKDCPINRKYVNSYIINRVRLVRIPVSLVLVFFGFSMIVAILRYYSLYLYAVSNGLTSNIFNVISAVRKDYSLGKISLGIPLAVGYYISQVSAYIFCFIFVYDFFQNRKKSIILYLLPVLGYILCAITTTSRIEFIKLVITIIFSIFVLKWYKKDMKISILRVLIFSILFIIFFLWYGFSMRGVNYNGNDSIISNIVNYTCSSIYGLSYYLDNPWTENSYFGEYTMNNIYTLFSDVSFSGFQPFFEMAKCRSNIYTSLDKPIQDFGVFGMIISRFLLAFVSIKIFNSCLNSTVFSKKFFIVFIFASQVFYIFIMAPIGDKAYLFFLNPKYLLELLVSSLAVVYIFSFCIQKKIFSEIYKFTNFIEMKGE